MQQRLAAKLAEGKVPGRIAKQVRMVDTSEGIRIDLVDDADFAMFQLGTTVLTSDAALLLKAIGGVIAPEPEPPCCATLSGFSKNSAMPCRSPWAVEPSSHMSRKKAIIAVTKSA